MYIYRFEILLLIKFQFTFEIIPQHPDFKYMLKNMKKTQKKQTY